MAIHGFNDVLKVTRDVEGLPSDECKCNGVPSTLLLLISNTACLKAISLACGDLQPIGPRDTTVSSSDDLRA